MACSVGARHFFISKEVINAQNTIPNTYYNIITCHACGTGYLHGIINSGHHYLTTSPVFIKIISPITTDYQKMKPKHIAFCSEYIKDHNATQAAIRAGYSEHTAKQIGSKLLTKIDIQAKVKELETEIYNRNMMTADEVLQSLADLARNGRSESTKVKALELLGKYHTLYTDKVRNEGELTISVVPPPKPTENNQ